jgi:hypothetical protein
MPGIETLANARRMLFEILERIPNAFKRYGDAVHVSEHHRLSEFIYFVPDDWVDIARLSLPPEFCPFADAGNGDYLGLLVEPALLRGGVLPVVLYSHEETPHYVWSFESMQRLADAIEKCAAGVLEFNSLRGTASAEVTRAIAPRFPHIDEGNTFAAVNAKAQETWRTYETNARGLPGRTGT